MATEPLFYKVDIFSLQRYREEQAKEAVGQLPLERFSEDETELTETIVASFSLDFPVIDESGIYQTDRQVQIDARNLPNRMVFDRSRPTYLDGTEITIHIPFTGDASLFDIRPSQHNSNPPMGDVDSRGHEVLLTYRTIDQNENIKAQYERTLQEIKQHLDWLRPEATKTDGMKQVVRGEIAKRKQAAQSHSKVVNSLGLPKAPPKKK